jgi:methylated-DNA-[protein]-cysteine S-methyltransferase
MKGKITLGLESSIGRLDVTLSEDALHRIDFGGVAPDGPVPRSVAPLFKRIKKELEEYFQGRRQAFDLPLDPDPAGTVFQSNVWAALCEVPYGEVVSYGDLARWAGRPKAVRAVGGACGANRIPIIIPCHRVVAKEGLGGFGGGSKMKKQLLKLEEG